MGVLHRVVHMIDWCFNDRLILCRDLLLLQDFLKPCDHIVCYDYVVHAVVFHG